jgi:hypothetical protein
LIEANDKGRWFWLWLCVERVLGQLLALIERVKQSVADWSVVEEQPPAVLWLATLGEDSDAVEFQPPALGYVSDFGSFKFHVSLSVYGSCSSYAVSCAASIVQDTGFWG